MLLDTLHPTLNLWIMVQLSIKCGWTSKTWWMIIVSPKGVLFGDLWHINNIGVSQKGKCLHQDIVSQNTSLVTAAFPSEQDIFTPPPVTQRSWMPFGRLSSVHRGHGTGLKLEGLFIFYMCWTMLFSGCEHNFLTFTNDPKEIPCWLTLVLSLSHSKNSHLSGWCIAAEENICLSTELYFKL